MQSKTHYRFKNFNTTEYGHTIFKDRKEAGKILTESLQKYLIKGTVLLGIPQGGVCVASEIAKQSGLPLDVVVTRKLRVSHASSMTFGALAPGEIVLTDSRVISFLGLSDHDVEKIIEREMNIMKEKIFDYHCTPDIKKKKNKTIILVDDGVNSALTMQAAIISSRILYKPKKIILAVPVGARDSIAELGMLVDDIVCINQPVQLGSLSEWYEDFPKITDDDVKKCLAEGR